MNALKAWWAALGMREKRLVSIAGLVVGLALLWLVALSPALRTTREAPAKHAQVDSQLQSMQAMAAEAQSLRGQRALSYDESLRSLEASVKQTLGTGAVLSVSDGRANLNLKGVSADALAMWLSQARVNARVVPNEARLQRSTAQAAAAPASASSAAANAPTAAAWDGTLVLQLPAR
jgi:general secretion pathway protein M